MVAAVKKPKRKRGRPKKSDPFKAPVDEPTPKESYAAGMTRAIVSNLKITDFSHRKAVWHFVRCLQTLRTDHGAAVIHFRSAAEAISIPPTE